MSEINELARRAGRLFGFTNEHAGRRLLESRLLRILLFILLAIMVGGIVLLLVGGAFSSKPAREDTEEKLQWRLTQVDKLELEGDREAILADQHDTRSAGSLKLVVLAHRHGDRTPLALAADDPLAKEPFWRYHGFSSLTNRGKARMYLLGELTRSRYATFLGPNLSKHQILSRSAAIERCLESSQLFLAGLMRPSAQKSITRQSSWSGNSSLSSLWQPVAIQMGPGKYDSMLNGLTKCERLTQGLNSSAAVQAIMLQNRDEQHLMFEYPSLPRIYWWITGDDRLSIQHDYFPDKLSAELEQSRARAREISSKVFVSLTSDLKFGRLYSGILINEILQHLEHRAAAGHDQRPGGQLKLVHLSTQDIMISNLLASLKVWDQHELLTRRPGYGSSVAFELHQEATKGWFVKVVYLNEVPGKAIELRPGDCSDTCTLEEFRQLLAPRRIGSWQSWMQECGNRLEELDPYLNR